MPVYQPFQILVVSFSAPILVVSASSHFGICSSPTIYAVALPGYVSMECNGTLLWESVLIYKCPFEVSNEWHQGFACYTDNAIYGSKFSPLSLPTRAHAPCCCKVNGLHLFCLRGFITWCGFFIHTGVSKVRWYFLRYAPGFFCCSYLAAAVLVRYHTTKYGRIKPGYRIWPSMLCLHVLAVASSVTNTAVAGCCFHQ